MPQTTPTKCLKSLQQNAPNILTGSTSVDDSKIYHTGTGRISRLKMYPMSLYESGNSSGEISLQGLFNDTDLEIDGIISQVDINQLIYLACRGGWPSALDLKSESAQLFVAKTYVENICESDISTVDGVKRNPVKTHLLLKSYARNISTLASNKQLWDDVRANEDMSIGSFYDYLDALKKLFVIEDVEAWSPNIRSKSSIRSSNKRELIDPSIATSLLSLSPEALQMDLKTFGFIFECMCIRDLKIYSQALGGRISYYHDRYGLEADAVLHLNDGRYALIEFKLGSREIDDGAKHLLHIRDLVREYNTKEKQVPLREPDLMMVITGGAMAYTRPDGVKVIPIACIKN